MTPEGKAKKRVIAELKALQAKGAKIKWFSSAGSPYGQDTVDITICFYGRFVALEVKRFDGLGKLTTRQKVCLGEVSDAGGISAVIDSEAALGSLIADLELTHAKHGLVEKICKTT